jgi:hypothetical protein
MTCSASSLPSLKTNKRWNRIIDDWTIDEVRLIVQLKEIDDCSQIVNNTNRK